MVLNRISNVARDCNSGDRLRLLVEVALQKLLMKQLRLSGVVVELNDTNYCISDLQYEPFMIQ
jgi:hypothetical protein